MCILTLEIKRLNLLNKRVCMVWKKNQAMAKARSQKLENELIC